MLKKTLVNVVYDQQEEQQHQHHHHQQQQLQKQQQQEQQSSSSLFSPSTEPVEAEIPARVEATPTTLTSIPSTFSASTKSNKERNQFFLISIILGVIKFILNSSYYAYNI